MPEESGKCSQEGRFNPMKENSGMRNGRGAVRRRKKPHSFSSGRRRINWKRFLPMLLLLAVFLYAAVNLAQYAIRSISTRRTNDALQALYAEATETPDPETVAPESSTSPTPTPKPELLHTYQYIGDAILPEAEELYATNPDMVAWLRIPGVVSLPVVYRDNSYYLDRDFYGKKSDSGTLFLDEAHPLADDTQYMVVHGHDMYDGSMFGRLSLYRRLGYMEEHSVVYLNTLYRKETYEVIGVLHLPSDVHSDGYVQYTGTRKFKSVEQFYAFAERIRENALRWKDGAEMLPSDALLALSTCYHEDERIVVMCRRTSP